VEAAFPVDDGELAGVVDESQLEQAVNALAEP